ncbi:MAG: hypothetical protein LBR70_02750 [Lactobacillaceae bacterium]|jgi:hypothetical protein|nr:hypothetical protein [Lactobacillaceae bacterium]
MAEIEFTSNELSSFYELWTSILGSKDKEIDENLNISRSEKDNREFKQYAKELKAVKPDGPIFDGLKKLSAELFKDNGSIKTFDDFKSFVKDNVSDKYDYALTNLYKPFHEFYSSAEVVKEREAAVRALGSFGYGKELGNMYKFFNVSEDFKIKGNINLYQTTFTNDGTAVSGGFFMNAAIADKNDTCLGNSAVQERKVSTPLHESAHLLFGKSKEWLFKNEIDRVLKGKAPALGGASRVVSILKNYFEKNPEAKRDGNVDDNLSGSMLAAIHESFGASASALIDEKKQPGYDAAKDKKRKWYYGFDGADKLAPIVYPIFKEYISKGKMLDDKFYNKLADNMRDFGLEKGKHLGQQEHKSTLHH